MSCLSGLLGASGSSGQHWYLFDLPLGFPSPRSSIAAVPLGFGFVWWGVLMLLWGFGLVGGCHRASKYYATLCPGSVCMAFKSLSFPQMALTDDAENHQWVTRFSRARNNTCIINREDLTESTGVVSAKYPPKVKLEFLTTLECQSGSIKHTYFLKVFGFL